MKALIIRVNKPRVRILTGSVNKSRTGFIKVLSSPKTIAVTTSAFVFVNQILSKSSSTSHKAAELIIILIIMFLNILVLFFSQNFFKFGHCLISL